MNACHFLWGHHCKLSFNNLNSSLNLVHRIYLTCRLLLDHLEHSVRDEKSSKVSLSGDRLSTASYLLLLYIILCLLMLFWWSVLFFISWNLPSSFLIVFSCFNWSSEFSVLQAFSFHYEATISLLPYAKLLIFG